MNKDDLRFLTDFYFDARYPGNDYIEVTLEDAKRAIEIVEDVIIKIKDKGKINYMTKVMFICHGNICRSPMAEFVFRDLIQKRGLGDCFHITSSATSREEIGNPVHPGTKNKLLQCGISTKGKKAVQLQKDDYFNYDYLIAMDQWNIKNIFRIIEKDTHSKIHRLLDYTKQPRDIADPWYTGDFDQTYEDVLKGCEALLAYILAKNIS